MKIVLAKPRGFCAGVERAIKCVEEALDRYGAPVYVLNDIVHNATVVNELRDKGAVFVKNFEDVPEGSHFLFSAHGVGPDRWDSAKNLKLEVIDATCPLVEKVHHEARRFASKDMTIILIGEDGHDETVGTMGWAPENIRLVLDESDVEKLEVEDESKLCYLTQTTLSVDDCQRVIDALKERFPDIQGPPKSDICYATSNRQAAVRALAPEVDLVLVVGSETSANSNRLAEICQSMGKPSFLIDTAEHINDAWLQGVDSILLTAGASAPEKLVEGVIQFFQSRYDCTVEEREVTHEDVHFKLPASIV
jgi:4-hydroxy-3-methylbut-2-enyl diphosphate reductase